jgi:hypothetical protein
MEVKIKMVVGRGDLWWDLENLIFTNFNLCFVSDEEGESIWKNPQ